MTTIAWSGGAGRWASAAQWSGGTVPQSGDDAVIAASGSYVVRVDDAEAAASIVVSDVGARLLTGPPGGSGSTLSVAGTTELSGGGLDVQLGSTVRASAIDVDGGGLLLDGGTLDGVTLQGTIVEDAFLNASFQNTLTNAGLLADSYFVSLRGDTFVNAGTVIAPELNIAPASTATPLVFVNTGVFATARAASDDIGFDPSYSPTSSGYFVNEGILAAYGSLTIRLQNAINSGQIYVAAGGLLDLRFALANGTTPAASGGLVNYGAIHVAAGGQLNLGLPGSFTLASLGSIDNQGGTVLLESGTLDLGGGTLDLSSVGALGAVQLDGVTVTDGTVTAPTGYVVQDVALDGATWRGALDTGLGGRATLRDGAMVLSATGGLARITGGITIDSQTLHQTALNVNVGFLTGNATLDAGSVLSTGGDSLTSAANASLTLQGRAYFLGSDYSLGLLLHNTGTVVLANGAIVQLGSVDGTGLIEIAGATLEPGTIAAGQTVSFVGPGDLALNAIYTLTYGGGRFPSPVLTPSSFSATVQNFGHGDTIDLGQSADTLNFAGGVLTASFRGAVVATIDLAGAYTTSDFQFASSSIPYSSPNTLIVTTKAGQPAVGTPVITVGPAIVAALSGTPLAGVTISDPDPASLDAVYVAPSGPAGIGAALSSPGGAFSTSYLGGEATGTAADLTQAIQAETASLYFNRPAVNAFGYTITAVNPTGASTATQPATFLNQYGAYANLSESSYAISALPDGSGSPATVAGKVNEVYAAAPAAGGAVFLPSGYQAAYAGGSNGITLADPGYGNAVLADAGGNDLIYAAGAGDVLIGGSGNDTLVATQGALIEATATSGSTLIFGGAGATTIFGPSLPAGSYGAMTQATIVSGTGDSTVVAQARYDLVALGPGRNLLASLGCDTIFAGAGASTITTSGRDSAPAFAVLGTGNSVVFAGTGSTVLGGMGASTVALGFNATMFGGAGDAVVSLQYVDQFVGGAGSATVFGQGGLVSGGTAGHNYIQMTEQNDIASNAFGGGGGDTLVSMPYTAYAAPYIYPTNLVAGAGSETLIASAGTKNTALYAGPGSDTVEALGATDTVYGGVGSAAVSLGGGQYGLIFDSGRGGGSTSITGFDATRDTISLTGYAPGTASSALANATVAQGAETLALGDGTRITLVGFSGLASAQFIG